MNTNEQTEKTLGQIAYEAHHEKSTSHDLGWHDVHSSHWSHWESVASAVEQEVLRRLPGEWIVLSDDENLRTGDEWYDEESERWKPLLLGSDLTGKVCRRRIRSGEANVEPEKPVLPDCTSIPDNRCPECGMYVPVTGHFCPGRTANDKSQWLSAFSSSVSPPAVTDAPPSFVLPCPWCIPGVDNCHHSQEEIDRYHEPVITEGTELVSSEELATLRNFLHEGHKQIATLTKERDEAREKASSYHRNWALSVSRAEQAEKKLAEVERVRNAHFERNQELAAECIEKDKQLSRHQWISVKERMPAKEDADKDGYVWTLDMDLCMGTRDWNDGWISQMAFWMTPIPAPLPTPTEEKTDAFEVWWSSLAPYEIPDVVPQEVLHKAFLAGQQSANSHLTNS